MSHWFDRLASRSAEGRDEREEGLLTRRQAVLAAGGVGAAAAMLGSPLLSRAFAEPAGCDCARDINRQFQDEAKALKHDTLDHGNGLLALATVPYFLIAYSGLVTGAFIGQQYHCGVNGADCGRVPSGKPPPPKQQPCTQRGGVRLRGDQCSGGAGAEVGSGCGPGTSSCPSPGGGDLCCFGSDICCSGCCCIAEVGCGCCG